MTKYKKCSKHGKGCRSTKHANKDGMLPEALFSLRGYSATELTKACTACLDATYQSGLKHKGKTDKRVRGNHSEGLIFKTLEDWRKQPPALPQAT